MRVFLIGGFLGSGKTTTVLKLIDRLTADGKKVALIVNEVGEIGIDGETLETAGIPSKELTNGCICCSLIFSLRVTVSEIADIHNPDILIMEPTGLSFPSQIRDELLHMNVMMSFAPVVTLVDVTRLKTEIDQIPKFVEQQLREAEIIGINKVDLADEEKIENMETFLKEMNPDAYTMRMSAKNDEAIDKLYELMMRESEETVSLIDTSGEPKAKVTENLNSIEISNVSTYSGLYKVSGTLTVKRAGTLLENIIKMVGMEVSKVNPSFVGHIKMAVKVNDTLVKVSQTAGADDRQIEAEYIKQEKTVNDGNYELRFLAAVTNVKKDKLEEIIDESVSVLMSMKNLTFEKQIIKGESKKPIVL
ncbi:hypothetical protein MmiHf6_11340 [Methanimicrococcus hongohii]|uniref:CobW/HypB/UreG nucleotide-binding domain-containing protein n=1 Tax=Methanimicrococcus hongohii TaxID=3028295 RepID=A0AA97A257_9EURY|nr:GTP-binding protein [Methanimicrococcus sp. Hf6]WNY23813.1 hypothetical protein MmiHf6_11340 [Methanimicrococcus sp. Hf6]